MAETVRFFFLTETEYVLDMYIWLKGGEIQ